MLEVKTKKHEICISCCDKNKSAREININRNGSAYKGANIVAFSLCDDCLRTLAKEFVPYS